MADTDLYVDWISALRNNVNSIYIEGKPPQPSYVKHDIERKIGVVATAYFLPKDEEHLNALIKDLPQLHVQFNDFTHNSMLYFMSSTTGSVSNKVKIDEIYQKFQESTQDGLGFVTNISKLKSKQSSPDYSFSVKLDRDSIQTHKPVRYSKLIYSYITVELPYSDYIAQKKQFDTWWKQVLMTTSAEQAYLGIGYLKPPREDQYRFIEQAELSLAQQFLGIDVDHPMFMAGNGGDDGNDLRYGLRPATYGVLLTGKWLDKIGGSKAINKLRGDTNILIANTGEGYWIEVDGMPKLYPIEDGVPESLNNLYEVMKPAILEQLWLVSFVPTSDDGIFTPELGHLWLKRFAKDSEWVGKNNVNSKEDVETKPAAGNIALWGGEVAIKTGIWHCPNILDTKLRKQHFNQGDVLPVGASNKGKYIWYYSQQNKD